MGQVDAAVARLEAALRARPRALLPDQVYSDAAARVTPPRVRSLDPDELDRVLEALRWAEDDPELKRMEDVIGKILAEGGEAALQEIGVDTAFRVDSPETRAWLHDKTIKFAQTVDDTTIENLREELLAGKAEGETYAELAARVEDVFDGRKSNALTVARTECLPGSTLVDGAVITAIHRRWYDGPMVEIVTAGGHQVSATPNHPVLTRRGWVGAGSVHVGDDLVRDARKKDSRPAREVDVQAGPPSLCEIFDSAKAVSVLERRRTAQPDFHGDGMDGEVDVLRPHRMLRVGSFAPLYEPALQGLLAVADPVRAPLCARCRRLLSIDQQQCLCRRPDVDTGPDQSVLDQLLADAQVPCDRDGALAAAIPLRDLGGVDVAAEVVRRRSVPLEHEPASLAHAAEDSGLAGQLADPSRVASDPPCDHRGAEPGGVEFERVSATRVVWFSGHVYNLSTTYGYYTANYGFFTGNTVGAANFGRMAAFLDADLEKHFWTTQRDQFVREEHQALEGETVAIGEPFSNGLRFPGDTENGSPDQVCNCRCDVAPVIPGVTERSASYIDAQWRAFAARVAAGERLVARQWLRMLRAQSKRTLAALAKAAR